MIKKIILFFPSCNPTYKGADLKFEMPGVPTGVVSLAAFIEKHGYEVKIIDGRIYDKKTIKEMMYSEISKNSDEILFGISVMTSQVNHAFSLSKEIKQKYPKIPIVWGGIHPTLYPEQTIKSKYVDYVIIGEGEFGFLELIHTLNESIQKDAAHDQYTLNKKSKKILYRNFFNTDFSHVSNLGYMNKNRIILNPQKSVMNVNELPDPAYHLLDIEKYVDRSVYFFDINQKNKRSIDLITSRGCPYRCSFCTNTLQNFKRWRPFNADRVNNMIDYMVNNFKIKHILFFDDYFFGSRDRVINILNHIIEKKYNLTWEAMARVNLFTTNYFNDEMLSLLKRSGCVQLRMGIESGSQRVLGVLKKDITLEQARIAQKTCRKYGIQTFLFFMGGIPGETRKEFYQTIDFMVELKKIHPGSNVQGPGLFRPYPGTELYEACKQSGFIEPKSLESWAKASLSESFGINPKDISWVDFAKEVDIAGMSLFNYMYGYSHKAKKVRMSIPRTLLYYFSVFRISLHFFKIPIETWLFKLKRAFEKTTSLQKSEY